MKRRMKMYVEGVDPGFAVIHPKLSQVDADVGFGS